MRYLEHADPVITLTAGPVNAYAEVLRGLGRTVLYDYDPAFQLFYEGVVDKGSMLGSGGVIVFDDSTDMVYQIMRLARFYAHESCAQCTQCREGTAWTTKILERILSGRGTTADLDLLLDLSENMTGKTICVLSDSCAAPVVSGIKKFKSEFEDYIAGRRKPVMVA